MPVGRENLPVIICGGGVIGAAVAYFLALRDVPATVVECSEVAGAASGKSGGFLALDWCDGSPLGPFARKSFDLHAKLADELHADYGYRRMTTLGVAAGELTGVADIHNESAWLDGRCAVYNTLGTHETTAQVHPARFTHALLDAAVARGATLLKGRVDGMEISQSPRAVQGVRVDGSIVSASKVVVAMGPWSCLASQWLPLPAVDGLKGFSIVLRPSTPVPAEALFVEYADASGARLSPEVVPRLDGNVYICGLADDQPLPDDPANVLSRPEATRTLHDIAGDLSGSLAAAEVISENACYRPIVGDGLPVLGAVPGVSGAFVATAHSCWGILNAPATGLAMAELIADGDASSVDIRPFAPERMAHVPSLPFAHRA